MDGLSLNIAQDRLSQLRQLFPEVFREDQIDFDALKSVLGKQIAPPTQERYGLTWAGKYDAYREIQKQTTATLTPDRANSIEFDTSDNVFIEGENLEVLRVLQKSYYGKVKMIYIDPPYNTGNDSFVYPDDYSERQDAYRKRTGITNEAGFLNKQDLWKKNTKESGQFHSVWLSMMFPRLFLARNLLQKDGLIFVSIDDNEQANLKLLMDEVFGEENFISCIKWEKRYTRSNNSKMFASLTEYILLYRRSDNLNEIKEPRNEKSDSIYTNPDNDQRGVWTSVSYVNPATKEQRPNLTYEIPNPFSGLNVTHPTNAWKFEKDTYKKHLEENKLYWGVKGENTFPRLKKFLSEMDGGMVPADLWSHESTGTTDLGSKILEDLFDSKVFDFPKPPSLIKRMLSLATVADENDIILDFFSGSGTTAQAVTNLNNEDGGNRRFITVQLPELIEQDHEAYKIGYKTIADISRARIRKVIEKQTQKQNGELKFQDAEPLGFRAYKLTSTHFKVWRSDLSNPTDILEQLAVFQHPLTVDYQTEALFTELLLKAGYPLTVPVEREELAGVPVYRVNSGTTYMALEGISRELIEALTARQPQRLITLDKLFNQDNELLSNTRLQLREADIEFTVI